MTNRFTRGDKLKIRSNETDDYKKYLQTIILLILFILSGSLRAEAKLEITMVMIVFVLDVIWFVRKNKLSIITEKYKYLFKKYEYLENLKFYRIMDEKKSLYFEKRKEIFAKLFEWNTFVFLLFSFFTLINIISLLLGQSNFLKIITVIFYIPFIIYFITCLIGIGYKYTNVLYILMPLISYIIYFMFVERILFYLPIFIKFFLYLLITILLYIVLSRLASVYMLRKIYSKAALISLLITISSTLLGQVFQYILNDFIQNKNNIFTIDYIKKSTDISESLKKFFIDNPDLVDVIRHLLISDMSNSMKSSVSIIIAAISISYTIGALIINKKITSNKLKAKNYYKKIIKEDNPSYSDLIRCSFHGGEEYENLLLSNNKNVKTILGSEEGNDVPV